MLKFQNKNKDFCFGKDKLKKMSTHSSLKRYLVSDWFFHKYYSKKYRHICVLRDVAMKEKKNKSDEKY